MKSTLVMVKQIWAKNKRGEDRAIEVRQERGKAVIAVYAGGPNPCYSLVLDSEQAVTLAIELIPAAPACGGHGLTTDNRHDSDCGGRGTAQATPQKCPSCKGTGIAWVGSTGPYCLACGGKGTK